MEVYVKLFATLRKYGPKELEIGESFPVTIQEGTDIETLLEIVSIPATDAKIIMVNSNIMNDRNTPLNNGDQISIFPPVGGGFI